MIQHIGARRRSVLVTLLFVAQGWSAAWLAFAAFAGAVLIGSGYSLVYPGPGVEAVRRVPPHSRGLGSPWAFTRASLI